MNIYLILFSLFLSSNANIINNELFTAKFNSNKITLSNNLDITYGYLVEENTNKEVKMNFNYILHDIEYSSDYVKTTLNSKIVNVDIINKIFTNISYEKNDFNKIIKFDTDKLYITININTWENRSQNNYLVLDLNFNKDINILQSDDKYKKNAGNIIQYGDYIINFPRVCNVDTYKEDIILETLPKKNNKLLIYFPYHQHHIKYTYTISMNKSNNIIYYILLGLIPIICISLYYYKKSRNNDYYNYNYNYKYKYY